MPTKTQFKYIHFEKDDEHAGQWNVVNNKSCSLLGTLLFYAPWNRVIFTQAAEGIVFSADCLRDIASFMEELGREAAK